MYPFTSSFLFYNTVTVRPRPSKYAKVLERKRKLALWRWFMIISSEENNEHCLKSAKADSILKYKSVEVQVCYASSTCEYHTFYILMSRWQVVCRV